VLRLDVGRICAEDRRTVDAAPGIAERSTLRRGSPNGRRQLAGARWRVAGSITLAVLLMSFYPLAPLWRSGQPEKRMESPCPFDWAVYAPMQAVRLLREAATRRSAGENGPAKSHRVRQPP
jgi:hypothetical protein